MVLDHAVDPESAANKGNVERWLLELEAMQWQSVRTQVTLALEEYSAIPREQWVLNWPAQAVLGVSQVSTAEEEIAAQRCCSMTLAVQQSIPILCFTRYPVNSTRI